MTDSVYEILIECVPPEIASRVCLYMQSPTASLIRNSKYFHTPLPFLYLRKLSHLHHRRYPPSPSYADCLAYYQYDVYWQIVQWQHPVLRGRYLLPFIHTNEVRIVQHPLHEYSENIGFDLEYYYTVYMNTIYHQLLHGHPHRTNWIAFLESSREHGMHPVVILFTLSLLAMFVIVTLFIFHAG